MAPDGMACNEFVELVTDYLEGALSPEDRARFEEHMANCAGCDTFLEQMRQTVAMLGRLPEESLSPTAQQKLLQAFRDWKKKDA